ncbi:hypothetical protein [Streptomyces hydrogenans]|uniref:hypothetical protein n=1 Tax=Streptomyces hydrogenans TaxID=1873719 RepID=UPI0035DF99E4
MASEVAGYSNVANPCYLLSGLDESGTSAVIRVSAQPGGAEAPPSGWPSEFPCWAVIDQDTENEEVVRVTGIDQAAVTIERPATGGNDLWFGAENRRHNAGAEMLHVAAAWDFFEANNHINSSKNVHGLALGEEVVGTEKAQTLKGKTLESVKVTTPNAATTNLSVAQVAGQTADPFVITDKDGTTPLLRVNQAGYAIGPRFSALGGSGGQPQFYSRMTAGASVAPIQFRDSADQPMFTVDQAGNVEVAHGRLRVTNPDGTQIGVWVRHGANPTQPYFVVEESSGADLFVIEKDGDFTMNGPVTITNDMSTRFPLLIKGAVGQSNLLRLENNAGTAMLTVDVNGNATFRGAITATNLGYTIGPWTDIDILASTAQAGSRPGEEPRARLITIGSMRLVQLRGAIFSDPASTPASFWPPTTTSAIDVGILPAGHWPSGYAPHFPVTLGYYPNTSTARQMTGRIRMSNATGIMSLEFVGYQAHRVHFDGIMIPVA